MVAKKGIHSTEQGERPRNPPTNRRARRGSSVRPGEGQTAAGSNPLERVDCDMVCIQGGEAGGHTGDIASSVLIPQCVDVCRGKTSPLTGGIVSRVIG